MRLAAISLFVLSCTLVATAQTRRASKWPATENTYVIHDFHFGSGETLPELNLHYLTIGQPHRGADGHIDNAILLLHGTGGDRYTLRIQFFRRPLRPRPALRTSSGISSSSPMTSVMATPPSLLTASA